MDPLSISDDWEFFSVFPQHLIGLQVLLTWWGSLSTLSDSVFWLCVSGLGITVWVSAAQLSTAMAFQSSQPHRNSQDCHHFNIFLICTCWYMRIRALDADKGDTESKKKETPTASQRFWTSVGQTWEGIPRTVHLTDSWLLRALRSLCYCVCNLSA